MKLAQVSLSSGEVSPSVAARVDVARYQTALGICRNFYVLPTGGVANRPGTRMVNQTKLGDHDCALLPFIFSDDQAYILEFGAGYIWAYTGAGIVASDNVTVANVTDILDVTAGPAHFAIFTDVPHGRAVGETVFLRDIVGSGVFTALNDVGHRINAVPGASEFWIDWAAGVGSYVSGGVVALNTEVASDYDEDEVGDLRYTQSADVMTLFHPLHPPTELRRMSSSLFSLSVPPFNYGPFKDTNADQSIYIFASAINGSVALSATGAVFLPAHVGALIRLDESDLANIAPWEPSKLLVASGANPYGLLRRSNGKVYQCVTNEVASGNGTYTGSVAPLHTSGAQPDGDGAPITGLAQRAGVSWLYLHAGFGIARITAVTNPTTAQATVLSRLPASVVGGAVTSQGPWNMVGDGATLTLAAAGADSDDSTLYEVTFDGKIQPPESYLASAAGDLLTFFTAPGVGVVVNARELSANNRTNLWAVGAWGEDTGYPSVGTYYQDRLVCAATTAQPQTEWASKSGDYHNHGKSVPLVASDAIVQTLNARQVNSINELIPSDQLISLTGSSSWATPQRGELWQPSTIGFDPQSFKGSAKVRAVQAGESAIHVSRHRTRIFDLNYQIQYDKFKSNELTTYSRHLFTRPKPIVEMDYSDEPDGLLHVVRADGVMPVLTYLRDEAVVGWARWDTQGQFKRVCVIPEDGRDAAYIVARRRIGGVWVRYVERFESRDFDEIEDAYFVDSGLSYDGRNTSTTTMYLTGGVAWVYGEELQLVASAIVSPLVADAIFLDFEDADPDDPESTITTRVQVTLGDQVSTYVWTVTLTGDVAAAFRNRPTIDWATAVDTLRGLGHLEGMPVVALADGNVIEELTVTDETVVLPEPHAVTHVGLSYTCDIQTMNLTIIGQQTIRESGKNIARVAFTVNKTRGLQAGPDAQNLSEVLERTDEAYDQATRLQSGSQQVYIANSWDEDGRVFARQAYPLPAEILAVTPIFQLGTDS